MIKDEGLIISEVYKLNNMTQCPSHQALKENGTKVIALGNGYESTLPLICKCSFQFQVT
jgi:hypothetical protein